MFKYLIKLSNGTDIDKLNKLLKSKQIDADLIDDENRYRTTANTILGALASIEWRKIYIVCDTDIKDLIADFIVEDKE